ncbi:MAG: DnaJ domain-containing protein [Pseudanabaenaceae cyanobacterium bins.39]|nr:DnaJ domain-containing protein [Pseudanabaenaceae cyanobacterium bins.39]
MNSSASNKYATIRINRGIGQFNHDYYAALGLPIVSSPAYIRHVYLSIARILHPDVYGFTPAQKEVATQFLAKLVNPAYDILMREEERKAYRGIFQLLAKRLVKKSRNIPIHSKIACNLMQFPSDGAYERAVSVIAKVQYQNLEQILEYTCQISELNLVYILFKEGYQYGDPYMPPVLSPLFPINVSPSSAATNINPPPSKLPSLPLLDSTVPNSSDGQETIIQSHTSSSTRIQNKSLSDWLRECEGYMAQKEWNKALKELRMVLQIAPNNSKCHALIGVVYVQLKQPQMAKISFSRSLQLNPAEPLALQYMQDISNLNPADKLDPKQNSPKIASPQQRNWFGNLLGWLSSDDK